MTGALRLVATHWYVPLFAIMLAAIWLLARVPAFMASGGEAALLADLCLTAPFLYILCYGRRQAIRKTIFRAAAISCAGVWFASWLIPVPQQQLLPLLTPLRWAGLVVIAIVEVRLVAAAIRIAFSGTGTPKALMEASDAPEWVARLMLWEANLWRKLWRVIRGRDKPRR